MKEITDTQRRVLIFIDSFVKDHGFPPTNIEIMDHFDWASTNSVRKHVDALIAQNFLTRVPGLSRALRVVRLPEVSQA